MDKDFAPEVIYIHGEPGSGKSRYVREHDPNVFDISNNDSYKWKDGYSGQDVVVYSDVSELAQNEGKTVRAYNYISGLYAL